MPVPYYFDLLKPVRIEQRKILVGCISEKGIIESHAVDNMQYFGAFEPPDNGYPLPWCGLLYIHPGLAQ